MAEWFGECWHEAGGAAFPRPAYISLHDYRLGSTGVLGVGVGLTAYMLGVRHALLAVTKADLADPVPVLADARARLARTSMGEVPGVPVSSVTGDGVPDVAAALDIHPFMVSLWRKQVRDGVIVAKPSKLDVETKAELKRLRELERQYKILKEEHELLKKAIRFASDRKRKSSNSSKQTGPSTKSQ